MKIAIQGEPGSFSEEAALNLLPQAKIDCCPSFREVFAHLADRVVDRALIPIKTPWPARSPKTTTCCANTKPSSWPRRNCASSII